jgi:hypothetical protein
MQSECFRGDRGEGALAVSHNPVFCGQRAKKAPTSGYSSPKTSKDRRKVDRILGIRLNLVKKALRKESLPLRATVSH